MYIRRFIIIKLKKMVKAASDANHVPYYYSVLLNY